MVKKVLLVAFASLSLSLAAPVPAKEDLPPTEVQRRQPRPVVFDNSIPGTHYPGQTQGNPPLMKLFPGNYLSYLPIMQVFPFISGSGLLNSRNLIPIFNQTNAATKASLGFYLINPFARSADESSLDVGSVSEDPALTVQQLHELQQMYNEQLTSVGQGATFNTPNLLPTSLYSSNVHGSPYDTSSYLSQFNQYNPFEVPNSNAIFAPYAALNSPLPGQESALSGLPFGITAPINGVETEGEVYAGVEEEGDSRKAKGSKA